VSSTKLLLTSVFGPYGVDDGYAQAGGMQMELLNNQVTRGQGVHSPRVVGTFSYGLYLIARNISVPSVVLDFPTWNEFVRELENGYTHVGIAFIIPNTLKVHRMATYIREHYPDVKIILGGAGTAFPNVGDLVPHDEICSGEGVEWLRRYFGDEPDREVVGAAVTGPIDWYYYGYRVRKIASQVFPGVGCKNACNFCHTTHFFKTRYTSFLPTGRAMFEVCDAEAREHDVSSFSVIDENFLKDRQRAIELLGEMEANGRPFQFCIFSSAETIMAVGLDFLVRLGVTFIWLGLEGKNSPYGKIRDVDLKALVRDLRGHGIRILGSVILFQEHHDEEKIQEDIDWAIDIAPDFLQFMPLCVIPGTALHKQFARDRRLIDGFPPERMTAADGIWFQHPHFDPSETDDRTNAAFRQNYLENGPSSLRVIETILDGYIRNRADVAQRKSAGLVWNPENLRYEAAEGAAVDTFMEARLGPMRDAAVEYRRALPAVWLFAPNSAARRKAGEIRRRYREALGSSTPLEKLQSSIMCLFAAVEAGRIWKRRLLGQGDIIRQPFLRRTEYPGMSAERGSARRANNVSTDVEDATGRKSDRGASMVQKLDRR
jgi:hypothetical protein